MFLKLLSLFVFGAGLALSLFGSQGFAADDCPRQGDLPEIDANGYHFAYDSYVDPVANRDRRYAYCVGARNLQKDTDNHVDWNEANFASPLPASDKASVIRWIEDPAFWIDYHTVIEYGYYAHSELDIPLDVPNVIRTSALSGPFLRRVAVMPTPNTLTTAAQLHLPVNVGDKQVGYVQLNIDFTSFAYAFENSSEYTYVLQIMPRNSDLERMAATQAAADKYKVHHKSARKYLEVPPGLSEPLELTHQGIPSYSKTFRQKGFGEPVRSTLIMEIRDSDGKLIARTPLDVHVPAKGFVR